MRPPLTERQREHLVTGGIVVLTLAVYLRSLMPGIGFSGDAAKWQLLSEVGGVPHATGYPLYVALIQLFGALTPFGSAAWRTNLFSALCAVAAVAVLYRLLRLLRVRPGVAAAAAVTFAVTKDFWTQAVIAEVYTLHVLLLVAILGCLARWRLGGSDRWLRAGIALLALSFGNHLTTLLVVPGVAWLVWSDRRRALTRDNVLWAGAVAVLGASQYLYLLYMTRVGGYVESPVHNLGDIVELVTGGPFKDDMLAFGPRALIVDRVPLLLDFLRDEYLVLLAPIGYGIWRALLHDDPGADDGRRDIAIALALLGAGSAVYGLNFDVPDVIVFFLPLFLVLAVFLGIGLDGIVDWITTRPWTRVPWSGSTAGKHHAPRDPARAERSQLHDRLARIGVAATLVAIPLVTGLVDYRSASQRGTTAEADRIDAALDAIGRHAVILTDNYNDSEFFWYHLIGEGQAETRDLALVHEATAQQVEDYFAGRPGPVSAAAAGVDADGGRPPLFTASPNQPAAMAAAGLEVTAFAPGVWRIDPDRRVGGTLPFGTTLDLDPPVTADYGGGLLDIYQPDASFTGPRPLLVYIHGGGWFGGSRADVRCAATTEPELRACVPATELARGYVVASIDYRLLSADPLRNRFPAPVQDVKQAVMWLRTHAAEHRIDPGRVVLVGHSAGATLAALAALTPGEWEPLAGYETHVDGFVSLVGPARLEDWATWLDQHDQIDEAAITRRLVGCDLGLATDQCSARLAEASPADPRWSDPGDPPGYLVCEESDPVVPCDQLWALHDTLFAAHDGDQRAVVVDVARTGRSDDDPHNPDTDLNLPALEAFLDRVTA